MKYALILLLLSGCAGIQPTQVAVLNSKVDLRLTHLEPSELRKAYWSAVKAITTTDAPLDDLNGFSYTTKGVCYVFVRWPKYFTTDKYVEILGHELTHCIYGQWHKPNGIYPAKLTINEG